MRSANSGTGLRGLIRMRNERHGGPRGDGFCDCTGWPKCCSADHPESPEHGNWALSRCNDRWCACRRASRGGNLQGSVVTRTAHGIGTPATEPIISVANAKEFYGRKRADLYTDCGVARRDSGFALIQAFSRLGAFRAGKREHERAEPRRVRPIS